MNVEGYVLDYINKIEEQGYDAYIVGKSVFLYMLGRPIEEYDIITSAPLFSLSKDQIESGNSVHILEHKKGIHISFFTSKESFYKNCCYKIDTLLYHHKHGLIDEKHGLDDLERKRITIFNPNVLSGNPLFLLEAIFYQAQYSFTLEKKLITYICLLNTNDADDEKPCVDIG
ncbi:MAG: hypothetical protein K2K50_01555, partial [Anaeroplasmataceae bacterium]|nr:hypothetical protein [Anaeroplasmataceae bacterium]